LTRILLLGKDGQVGWELARALPALGELQAYGRQQADLADLDGLRALVQRARPDVIVNAAAYTEVDRAETEPELAMAVNGAAPGLLAEEARQMEALLLHLSTDYVFDGKARQPYRETDPPNPISVYGRSKLAGEQAVQSPGARALILRTSWIYSLRRESFVPDAGRRGGPRPVQPGAAGSGTPSWAVPCCLPGRPEPLRAGGSCPEVLRSGSATVPQAGQQ
jgi:dTDP-4-dehydrorhamnose reductase